MQFINIYIDNKLTIRLIREAIKEKSFIILLEWVLIRGIKNEIYKLKNTVALLPVTSNLYAFKK
jgi:hypothetical protein